ncbi:MAG: hypothetical protein NPIRA02_26980 [Nitrospirales bacterium]|nr:MAG: hypothetical protein NPIRA02_26980 [Nitrospirales bacterium]
MPVEDVLFIATTILASLGGGVVIVFALSNWLGKLWAERLMEKERAKHAEDLLKLRDDLQTRQNERIETLKNDLHIFKETHLKEHSEKIVIYRDVIDIVATMLSELEGIVLGKQETLPDELLKSFERKRYRAYGYLGMFAPQKVMDAQDTLMDCLLSIIYDGKTVEWETIRNMALAFINAVRDDVGINKECIDYRGSR